MATSTRGSTWSREEVQCLLEIWAQENRRLDKTHKNTEIFRSFRDRMIKLGYNRSIDQCRTKVKKMRVRYRSVQEALRTSGSAEEIVKFPWYDAVDRILGKKAESLLYSPEELEPPAANPGSLPPISEPDSTELPPGEAPESSGTVEDTSLTPLEEDPSAPFEDTISAFYPENPPAPFKKTPSAPLEDTLPTPFEETADSFSCPPRKKKRKPITDMASIMSTFIDMQKQQFSELMEAETSRQRQEQERLDAWMNAQMEMEERRLQMQRDEWQEMMQMMRRVMDVMEQSRSSQQYTDPSPRKLQNPEEEKPQLLHSNARMKMEIVEVPCRVKMEEGEEQIDM